MSRSRRISGVQRLWPIALVVVIALAGLGFLITHPEGLFHRHSDLLAENLGTQTVFHDAWQSRHRVPLWRSDILSGGPALTNPQSLYTHPFHALFAVFAPERVVGLVIWLQMLLAAIGAYYAGVVLRLSVAGRLMVAVAMLFSFKTIMAAYAGWLAVLAGIAAMPLLFATVAVVLERPSRHSALAAGLAGALALHSGHPQLTYYALLFLALWTTVRLARLLARRDPATATRTVRFLVLGGSVALGLWAYLLVPLVVDVGLITRAAASHEFFTGSVLMPVRGLLMLLDPELFGTPLDGSFVESWEFVIYFGAVPSLLILAAVVRGRSRPMTRVLMCGLGISLVLAVGSPLLKVLHAFLPGYGSVRLPARILFVGSFFGCCLAGIGLDEVLSAARTARSRRMVGAVLIGLTAIEGTLWARRYLRTPHPIPFALGGEYLSVLGPAGEPARIAPLSISMPAYGSAARLGLELVTGFDPFNMRHYQAFQDVLKYGQAFGSRAAVWTNLEQVKRFDMLAALNVRFLLSPQPLDIPSSGYSLVATFEDQAQFQFYEGLITGPVFVYRSERDPQRAFFVSSVQSVADDDAMIRAVQRADLHDTAVVLNDEGGPSAASEDDRVEILRAGGGEVDLLTRNAGRRFLVVSEVWHPGWRARVDGVPVRVSRADIALQGFWIPPGEHRVELRFWPPGFSAGLTISGLTAVFVLACLGIPLWRRAAQGVR